MNETKKKLKKLSAYKRYYQKHKEKIAARRIKWRKDNPVRSKFLYAKADAKRRKLEFSVTQKHLESMWLKGCTYCGKDLLSETGISADRLDNNLGYTEANIVPCCGICNSIKSNILTYEEMKVAMTAIVEYRHGKESHNS
jgi:5-methylcytosine-specific restriction endonuclease McrA